MGHYWAADTPIEIRRELARDWLEDLGEFGPEIVGVACREWRQNHNRRPTPADIRLLCIAEQRDRQPIALPRPAFEPEQEVVYRPTQSDIDYVDRLVARALHNVAERSETLKGEDA